MNVNRQSSGCLPPIESDTSEHSFRFEERREAGGTQRGSNEQRRSAEDSFGGSEASSNSPFGQPEAQTPAMSRGPEPRQVPERKERKLSRQMRDFWQRRPDMGRAWSAPGAPASMPSGTVRVSMDVPSTAINVGGRTPIPVTGQIVRRRRRIPVWLAIGFGLLTCCSLILAISLAPLVVFNFRIIRKQRAAKSVNDLSNQLVPMIQAIYNKTMQAHNSSQSP